MLAEMGDDTFRLGNVHETVLRGIMLSEALLEPLEQSFTLSAPMCSDCAFEPYCGADPVFHHATTGDFVGRKPMSAFCQRNMAHLRAALERYETMPTRARRSSRTGRAMIRPPGRAEPSGSPSRFERTVWLVCDAA